MAATGGGPGRGAQADRQADRLLASWSRSAPLYKKTHPAAAKVPQNHPKFPLCVETGRLVRTMSCHVKAHAFLGPQTLLLFA